MQFQSSLTRPFARQESELEPSREAAHLQSESQLPYDKKVEDWDEDREQYD